MSSRQGPLSVQPSFTSEPSCCAAIQSFLLAALMVRANVPSTCCLAGKAYLCMGQLDEADSQYKRALELEPGSAAIKGEAQLVDMIRSNLRMGRECLEAGDPRYAPPTHPPDPASFLFEALAMGVLAAQLHQIYMQTAHAPSCVAVWPSDTTWTVSVSMLGYPACHAVTDCEGPPRQMQILPM